MDLLYRLYRSFMDEPFRNTKAFLNPVDPDSPTPFLELAAQRGFNQSTSGWKAVDLTSVQDKLKKSVEEVYDRLKNNWAGICVTVVLCSLFVSFAVFNPQEESEEEVLRANINPATRKKKRTQRIKSNKVEEAQKEVQLYYIASKVGETTPTGKDISEDKGLTPEISEEDGTIKVSRPRRTCLLTKKVPVNGLKDLFRSTPERDTHIVSVRKAPPSIKVPDMFMALDAFTQLYYNTLVELQDMREEVEVEEVKRKEFEHKLDDLQNHLAAAQKRLLEETRIRMEAEEKIDLFKNEHNRLKDFSVQMQQEKEMLQEQIDKMRLEVSYMRLLSHGEETNTDGQQEGVEETEQNVTTMKESQLREILGELERLQRENRELRRQQESADYLHSPRHSVSLNNTNHVNGHHSNQSSGYNTPSKSVYSTTSNSTAYYTPLNTTINNNNTPRSAMKNETTFDVLEEEIEDEETHQVSHTHFDMHVRNNYYQANNNSPRSYSDLLNAMVSNTTAVIGNADD